MSGKPLAQWHIPSALCTLFLSLLLAEQPRVALSQSLCKRREKAGQQSRWVSFPKSQRVWATSLGQSWGPGVFSELRQPPPLLWRRRSGSWPLSPCPHLSWVLSTWHLEWTPDTEGWNCRRLSSPRRLRSHIPSIPVEEVMTNSQRGTEEVQCRPSKDGDLWFPRSSWGWLGLGWREDRKGLGDALGLEGLSARSLKGDLISPHKGYSIPSLAPSHSHRWSWPWLQCFVLGHPGSCDPGLSLGLLLPTLI